MYGIHNVASSPGLPPPLHEFGERKAWDDIMSCYDTVL